MSGSPVASDGRLLTRVTIFGFDFDGEIIDSANVVVRWLTEAFDVQGIHSPGEESIRPIIGLPLDVGVAKLLEDRLGGSAQVGELVVEFRSIYRERTSSPTAAYPGIVEEAGDMNRLLGA